MIGLLASYASRMESVAVCGAFELCGDSSSMADTIRKYSWTVLGHLYESLSSEIGTKNEHCMVVSIEQSSFWKQACEDRSRLYCFF